MHRDHSCPLTFTNVTATDARHIGRSTTISTTWRCTKVLSGQSAEQVARHQPFRSLASFPRYCIGPCELVLLFLFPLTILEELNVYHFAPKIITRPKPFGHSPRSCNLARDGRFLAVR